MKGQDELGFDVDPFEKAFGQLAGPVHWPSLTETERPQAFADLREWVEQLADRFAIEIRVIPPCWYRHNGMVEALSALRDHERMSFSDHGSPTGAVDWFRAFREIEMRLMDLAARTQCSVQEHRTDAVRSWRTNEHDWSVHLGLAAGISSAPSRDMSRKEGTPKRALSTAANTTPPPELAGPIAPKGWAN